MCFSRRNRVYTLFTLDIWDTRLRRASSNIVRLVRVRKLTDNVTHATHELKV